MTPFALCINITVMCRCSCTEMHSRECSCTLMCHSIYLYTKVWLTHCVTWITHLYNSDFTSLSVLITWKKLIFKRWKTNATLLKQCRLKHWHFVQKNMLCYYTSLWIDRKIHFIKKKKYWQLGIWRGVACIELSVKVNQGM